MEIEPLTHCNKDGQLYERSPKVVSQIQSALQLEHSRLIDCARLDDQSSEDYLQEESLVYLVREYQKRKDRNMVNLLSEILMLRMANLMKKKLGALPGQVFDHAYQDVIGEVFGSIIDLESDKGDFLQVAFWTVVERRSTTAFNQFVRHYYQEQLQIPADLLDGTDFDGNDNNRRTPEVSLGNIAEPIPSLEEMILSETTFQNFLAQLDEKTKVAFLLYYLADWQIESKDPDMPTLSRLFNKEGRTIRYWLTSAKQKLERWRDEQHT